MNASIVRWTKTHTIITAITSVSLLVLFLLWQTVLHTVAQSNAPCPSTYIIGISTGTITNQSVGGIVPIAFNAQAQPSGVMPVSVDFYSSTVGFLGSAVKAGTGANGSYWNMPLYTQLIPNSSMAVYANVTLSDGTSCNSTQAPLTVNNPTAAQLQLASTPPGFTGPTNTVINFSSSATVNGATVLPYSKVDWTTTVGTIEKISGVNGAARLFTGPLGGTGRVTAVARYGGKTVTLSLPVSVIGSNTTTAATTVAPTTTAVATSATGSNISQQTATVNTVITSATTPEQQTKLATSVQDCASGILGVQRAADIKAGMVRPTPDELIRLKPCFAQVNYVVPNTFAPVAPTKISELSTSDSTKIIDLANIKTSVKKDAIKISGKGKPGSTIMVYVFSEPLVITTSTDANGDWSYTLEDPLAPGKHEVYAVVDKGDGQYQKTDPFSFVIGRAEASAENPSGLSLKLESDATPTQSNRNIYMYLGVFGALLLVGLLVTILLFRRWNKHNDAPPPPTISFTPPAPPTIPNYPT